MQARGPLMIEHRLIERRLQKQGELFRAFVVSARDRYEVTRNAQAYRRALGQEP